MGSLINIKYEQLHYVFDWDKLENWSAWRNMDVEDAIDHFNSHIDYAIQLGIMIPCDMSVCGSPKLLEP
jgi:hypothetical protein